MHTTLSDTRGVRQHTRESHPRRHGRRQRHPLAVAMLIGAALWARPRAAAQGAPDAAAETRAARSAMDRLDLLAGAWEGTVSIVQGPNARLELRQREQIRRAANGTALLIEGTGRFPDAAADAPPAFEAMAVITWDAPSQRFRMLAAGGSGRALSLEPEVRADGLTWGFDGPGNAKVRYTITITDGTQWREVGETSRDGGTTWFEFLRMELRRTEAATPRR